MKTYITEGIVFRTVKYRETSIVVDIYTEEKGLRSFICHGIRSSKKSTMGIYQPMNILELVCNEKDADKLAYTKEVKMSIHYKKLYNEMPRMALAIFSIEVIRNSIKEQEADKEVYAFTKKWLLYLDEISKVAPLASIFFLIKLSGLLGFEISIDRYGPHFPRLDLEEGVFTSDTESSTVLSDSMSSLIVEVSCTDLCNLDKIQSNNIDKYTIIVKLLRYFAIHISGFRTIKSLDILRQVLHSKA